jgi:hypothetical protein
MKLIHNLIFPNNLHFNPLYLCYAVSNLMLFDQTLILLCHNDYWIRKWWWNRETATFDNAAGFFPTMRTLKRRSIFFVLQEVSRNIHRDNQCNNFTFNLYEILRQQTPKKFGKILEISNRQKLREFLGRVL